MKCPACESRPCLTDGELCYRCQGDAEAIAVHNGHSPADPDIVKCFMVWAAMVKRGGGSLPIAVMCELGQAPGVRSDSTFFRGYQQSGGAQFDGKHPMVRRAYTQPAKEAGVSITGKTYVNEVAAFPGDPRAWVSDKGEAKRVVEKRGWSCPELGVGPSKDLAVSKRPKRKTARDFFKSKAG